MENVLGGLNYDANLGSEDHKTYRDLIEKEILSRFKLGMGAPPYSEPKFGIVDVENPSLIATSDTARPLSVSIASVNPLQVSIAAGTAVTKSGAVVQVDANIFSKELARIQANDVNVVYLENELVTAGSSSVNDFMDDLKSQELQSTQALRVDLLENFLNVSLYPITRKNNIVVLAVVTVLETSSGSFELSIDQTKNTYSFIRPWFSFVDIEHRASVGTGTVSETNPHGSSINDLDTTGSVNLFQGLSDSGLVVSRDMKMPKVLGSAFCTESIPVSRIKTDLTGLITKGSKYGGVGAKYVALLSYPETVGSCYTLGTPSNGISVSLVPGSNIIAFGPNEVLDKDMVLEYLQVSALLPPVDVSNNLLTFGQPNDYELLVVGGKTQPTIPDPTINFEGSGPFPRKYKVYLLENKSLVSYPQTILPATRLDTIGTTFVSVNTVMQQPARLRVAMTRLDLVMDMSVRMVIYGVDTAGNNITEYVTISAAGGYVDESIPSVNYDSPAQGVYTTNIFKQVNTIQVLDRINDGPLSVVQIWAEIEQSTAEGLNDALQVAEIYWNGQGINAIKDLRQVSKGFTKITNCSIAHDAEVLLSAVKLATSNPTAETLFSEDFENMKHLDTVRGFGTATKALGYITINNNAGISAGDTITLKPGKVLTAVIGTVIEGSGQFALGATTDDTKANIMAAINHTSFNSGCTAYIDDGAKVKVVLNSPVGSAANDIKLQVSVTIPNAIEVSGFSEAYEGYNECFFERSIVGLSSVNVPSNTELTPIQYHYRNKYRSRAIALPFDLGVKTGFILAPLGLNKNKDFSFRIRGSYIDDSKVWTEWKIMTQANGVFEYTFSQPVHKIQVEVYGTLKGIATYAKV